MSSTRAAVRPSTGMFPLWTAGGSPRRSRAAGRASCQRTARDAHHRHGYEIPVLPTNTAPVRLYQSAPSRCVDIGSHAARATYLLSPHRLEENEPPVKIRTRRIWSVTAYLQIRRRLSIDAHPPVVTARN